jgi:hypothetical protein
MRASTKSRLTFLQPVLPCIIAGLLTTSWVGCAKVQQNGVGGGSGGSIGSVGTNPPIPNLASLTVSPPTQTVTLMPNGAGQFSAMTSFTAQATLTDGSSSDATSRVNWTLDPKTAAVINGAITVGSPGIYTVSATSGAISAQAQLLVNFSGDNIGTGFDMGDKTKLDGTTSGAVTVAYPLDGAIFPSNFGAVTVQIAKSTGAQDIARLTFSGDGLDVRHYGVCETGPGAGCYVTLPSAVTKLFLATSAQHDIMMTARLGSKAGGSVSESSVVRLAWANVPLSGGLYYWTTIPCPNGACPIPGYTLPTGATDGTAVMRYRFDGDAPVRELVWTDQGSPNSAPAFGGSPAVPDGSDSAGQSWGAGHCIGCHAISFDGKVMAFSIGGSAPSSLGLLDIAMTKLYELDPNAAPANAMGMEALKRDRKVSFATFTTFGPKTDLMVNMFRGVLSLHQVDAGLATVRDNLFMGATSELKTDPFWSPDGNHFAFASYDPGTQGTANNRLNGDTKNGAQIWSATADATGPHEDAKLIVPRQAGYTNYYPSISHDGTLLVYNRSSCSGPANVGGYGTLPCDGYDDITAALWLTDPAGKAPINLGLANGADPNVSNSWPRWSPDNGSFRGLHLYWLAFSSRRPYGLQVNGGAGTGAKPQLWFSAILVGNEFGTDPSHAPVWLPDQNLSIATPTGNHVPQWVKFAVPIE